MTHSLSRLYCSGFSIAMLCFAPAAAHGKEILLACKLEKTVLFYKAESGRDSQTIQHGRDESPKMLRLVPTKKVNAADGVGIYTCFWPDVRPIQCFYLQDKIAFPINDDVDDWIFKAGINLFVSRLDGKFEEERTYTDTGEMRSKSWGRCSITTKAF